MESTVNNDYLNRVKAAFSGEIESAELIKSGWSNVVVDVNQAHIFRFIRHPGPQFEVEKAFLQAFAPVSPIPIPAPTLTAADFIAYPRLAGERFAPEKFAMLSAEHQDMMLGQLGRFLSALHSSAFTDDHLSRFPYGGGDFWRDLWGPVEPLLSQETAGRAKHFFEQTLERIESASFQPCLVHSDLGTNNLLVDFDQPKLTGIIDFSDLAWGDPAADFAGFYRNFGQTFVLQLLDYYDRPLGNYFGDRIAFESARKQFFVIYFARKFGFDEYVPTILQNIEKLFDTLTRD